MLWDKGSDRITEWDWSDHKPRNQKSIDWTCFSIWMAIIGSYVLAGYALWRAC